MALIRTLTAWGGHDFNHQHGDTVEVSDEVAEARIAAGLAEPVEDETPVEGDAPATISRKRKAG